MTVRDNPYLSCPDACCSLKGEYGLGLSKDDFEPHFRDRQEGGVVTEVLIF